MIGAWMETIGRRLARRRAASWFARLRAPDAGEADRRRLRRWLGAAANNRSAFEHCEITWSELGGLGGDPAVQKMLEEARASLNRPRWRRAPPGMRRWHLAALIGVPAVVAVMGIVVLLPDTYTTDIGERRDITLDDGSIMFLNADTSVAVRYLSEERAVHLRHGEAAFRVENDPRRPFTVRVAGGHVRALGTEFAVRYRGKTVDVAVLEGCVEVAADARTAVDARVQEVELGAGYSVRYEEGGDVSTVREIDLSRIAPWRRGKIYFEAARLEDAVAEYSLYTPVRIRLATPDLAEERITGLFNTGDLDGFLFALEQVLDVHSIRQRDRVILIRAAHDRSARAPAR